MEKDISYKGQPINSFQELVSKYGKAEFKSPYRSTIPLLLLFNSETWHQLNFISDIDQSSVTYIFENETPVRKGVGRASCTDLMIISANAFVLKPKEQNLLM